MNEFILFGTTHLLTLGIIFVVSFGFSFFIRDKYSLESFGSFEKILGFALILNELLKPFYLIALGDYKWTNTVPLHACHISSYTAGLFLLTREQRFFDFAYFWGLGGGTMALLTPDVEFTFPDLDFITLFFGHGLLFFSLIYIVIVIKQKVTFGSLINALKYSLILLPIMYVLNVLIGGEPGYEANLWYLMKAPAGESLMSLFPAPPWHVFPVFPLVAIIFYMLYLPFYFAEKKSK
ncbi:MAG: TIGR02206 family membrane protein [Candidatus Neomarinimicrobiota bacterium]|nr:TIGR02206 family membrane protein [Candidatus Neomarinimicrobiota bacterium]|tara:strand:+ start:975 stop:1682 length:708 start_codon:yes stop_codon:yes gene_type:complete